MSAPLNKEPSSQRHFWILLLTASLLGILSFLGVFWRHYNAMTLKAKNREARKNLKEICQAEQEYFRTHGVYLKAGPTPQREPNKSSTPFDSPHIQEWKTLKWAPDMDVRCQYTVFFTKSDGSEFKALARCDADGDGDYSQFQMDKECFVFQSSGQWVF